MSTSGLRCSAAAVAVLIAAAPVQAQNAPALEPEAESIVITAPALPSRVLPPNVGHNDRALIDLQPRTAGDALRDLPGVSVRTNSRGETIARVRGSEERQTQIFLDGAPLSVPWDGRADLGIIPAGLIGSVRVLKGAAPIEFGTNALAGAVDFQTRSARERSIRGAASVGLLGSADGWAVVTVPLGSAALTLSAPGITRDSEPVASHRALPFSQDSSNRRTNTDLDSLSLFGAVAIERGPIEARASLLRVSSSRGIAPESDRDPAVDAPRYWRYPEIDLTQLTVNGKVRVGERSELRLVGWRQWFTQDIVQYRDVSYSAVRAREADRDDTIGGRAVLALPLNGSEIRLVGNAQTSLHRQVDCNPAGVASPRLSYRQTLTSIGAEGDVPVGLGKASLGVAWDRSANPLAGDKPAQPTRSALAFSAALLQPLGHGFALVASGGRRNRFPSARELFGEALGRFLPNPDLNPEQSWTADLELKLKRGPLELSLNPFLVLSRDTISQRIILVDGVRRRQRFNLTGSTSYGIDTGLRAPLGGNVSLDLGASLLRARADSSVSGFRRLVQRPSYEAFAALDWLASERLFFRAELRAVGPAVDLAPDGGKERLKPGQEVNLRARYRIASLGGRTLSLTAAADNVTDAVITPQLGLPAPGRGLRIGLLLGD